MQVPLLFRSIRARLVTLFVAVALLPLVVTSLMIYSHQLRMIRQGAAAKLVAIREQKVQRINAWIDDIFEDIEVLVVREQLTHVLGGTASRPNPAVLARTRALFKTYVASHAAIAELQLLDPRSGRVLVTTDARHADVQRSFASEPFCVEPLRTQRLFVGDIHESAITHDRRLVFAKPLLSAESPANVVAILVADINLQYLDTIIQESRGMGRSGETLIVNRDAIALNNLRWRENAQLQLQISALPAQLAAQGKTGVVAAKDYRGASVLAAYTFIPRTRWGVVIKQELSELYRPTAELTKTILILIAIAVVFIMGLAVLLAESYARPVNDMRMIAEALQQGDLTARNTSGRADELGDLARAFNSMADAIQQQMAEQHHTLTIIEAMVNSRKSDDFCNDLLHVVMEATQSEFGAIYLLDNYHRFTPMTSRGLTLEAMQPFDATACEGGLGMAIATRQRCHLRDIPEDTRFTFRTFIGTTLPREMLTIPVTIGGEVMAIIALASLHAYSPLALRVTDATMSALAIGFHNVLTYERSLQLAQELSTKNSTLEEQTVELSAQACEITRQADTLRAQNAVLEAQAHHVAEANRLKSEFLANMSHELRTPLNSILALSHVLGMEGHARLTPEEIEYLDIIERNGKHLLSLINDILDLAKIESGKVDLHYEEFSLRDQIMAIAATAESLCQAKGLTLRVTVPEHLPPIVSDVRRVQHILMNIIGNAVKFTQAGGICVTVQCRDTAVTITVTDTGIGIPAHALPHVFDEFRQVDGGTARAFEGTGLGLAIAAKSAHMLGGEITVASTLGVGSTFTVTLPRAQAACRPPLDAPQPTAVGCAADPEGTPQDAHSTPRTLRLLLVEDSEPAIIQITTVLGAARYHVAVARGGEEALQMLETLSPDGIILDLMMPHIDGFTVLEQLRGTPATAQLPVLILTAKDLTPDDLRRLSANHIQQLVQKGDVDRQELLQKIACMLSPPPPAHAAVPPGEAFRGMRPRRTTCDLPPVVLAIEDNPDNVRTLRAITQDRYTLLEASDGETGLQLALRQPPDLILLDMSLPRLDGYAVAQRLRAEASTRHIPIIALTAHAMPGDREKALAAGCDEYLTKPLDVEHLLARCAWWLGLLAHPDGEEEHHETSAD